MEQLSVDMIHTRRAVFTAMRPFLEDVDLLTAMMIWQEKYANKSSYAFTQFLSECCRTTELKRSRPSILNAIFESLELAEQNLLPDPFNRETGRFDILTANHEQYAVANTVFMRFLTILLGHLGEDLALKVKAYLMKHVGVKLKLNTQQAFALKTWAHRSATELNAAFDNKQKQAIINIIYIAICEYIGPVKADQLLALTVKEVEPFAKTHQVDLHDYL